MYAEERARFIEQEAERARELAARQEIRDMYDAVLRSSGVPIPPRSPGELGLPSLSASDWSFGESFSVAGDYSAIGDPSLLDYRVCDVPFEGSPELHRIFPELNQGYTNPVPGRGRPKSSTLDWEWALIVLVSVVFVVLMIIGNM